MEKLRPASPSWTRGVLYLVVAAFYIPLALMVFESLRFKEISGDWSFSLHWYQVLFSDQALMESLLRSVVIAAGASFIACIVGTFSALAIHKYRFKGVLFLDYMSMVSLVIPELVFALALLSWFAFLKFPLGYLTVIFSHATFCIAFVAMTVTARLNTLDKYLDEAAHDLGATQLQTLWKVILPVLKPAIIAGFILSFLLSFDDFLITFYTSGPGTDTLPIKLYSSMKIGLTPKLHALAVLMMVISVGLILILSRMKGVRELLLNEDS